jgi:hypothetical protein
VRLARVHQPAARSAEAAALPISTTRKRDKGIQILPTHRNSGTGPRHAQFLVLAKDRPQVRLRQAEISFRVSE